jgi:hypothetical protein
MKFYEKNQPTWSKKNLLIELEKFYKLYKDRPIKDNKGGMKFEHMFAVYYILKKINPDVVIESGVFKGQSTWLIEKTLPNSKIISIDIDLSKREYISKKAKYSSLDFEYQDFSELPPNTLVFFDDHVNHVKRIQQAKYFNIKNIILEDNYRSNRGDFYTINHALNQNGFNHKIPKLSTMKTFFLFSKECIKKIFYNNYFFSSNIMNFRVRDVVPNRNDKKNLLKIISVYYEFPPIKKITSKKLDISFEELGQYNYITYIKLI